MENQSTVVDCGRDISLERLLISLILHYSFTVLFL